MPDLRDRFRSLDRSPAPDLWAEVADRAQAPQKTNWPFTLAAVATVVLVAAVIGLQLRSGALVSGPGPTETASPATSAEATPSAQPSPSVGPSAELSPSSEPPPFTCGETITSAADSPEIRHLADVRLGSHDGYDRIVFEYGEAGVPAFEIRTAEPPYVHDGSGMPMSVDGEVVYRIAITGGTKMGDDGMPTYTGSTDFRPSYPQIVQLVESADYEAVNTWYLGVNGTVLSDPVATCLRVFQLTNPSRIVIDVQH